MKKVYITIERGNFSFCIQYKKEDFNYTSSLNFGDSRSIVVSEPELQKAIESSKYFKSGIIKEYNLKDRELDADNSQAESLLLTTKEYPKALNIQQAKEILINEYKVHQMKLLNAENVKRSAEKYGVAFPNVIWE